MKLIALSGITAACFFLSTATWGADKNYNTKPYPLGNPVIKHMYTADAAPKVMPDGRVWMVTSIDGDEGGGYATMHSTHAFSSADMVNWVDHGRILDLKNLGEKPGEDWALWAPDIIYRNGTYYLYVPMRNILADGTKDTYTLIAESDRMDKPFKVTNPRLEGAKSALDPAVFIDDDGQAYLYWNQTNMGLLKKNLRELDGPSFKLDLGAANFMEAAWMHKRNGKYYFNYHTKYNNSIAKDNPDDPARAKSHLDYSYGESPKGPLTYGGTLNYELGVNVKNGPQLSTENGISYVPWRLTQSNHGGVVEYHGQEYLFYHTSALSSWRQSEFKGPGTWTQRSVSIDYLNYDENGKVIPVQQTIEGVNPVKVNQPFSINLKMSAAQLLGEGRVKRDEVVAKNATQIKFSNVDLGTGYYYFGVKVNKTVTNGKIEVRRDAPNGLLMGTLLFDGDSMKINKSMNETFLREARGKHDVYLNFVINGDEELRVAAPRFFAGSPLPAK